MKEHRRKHNDPDNDLAQSGMSGQDREAAEGTDATEKKIANQPAADLSLREQLEAVRAERDANYNSYLRSEAELQNYRKRVQKEADELRLYQALPLARDLIPALDNLYRALSAAETSKNVDELVQGVRLVSKQIETALSRHHVVPIEAVGKPFDPNLHQAIQQIPTGEHPPMTVIQEAERGFTLKDRVVRPASVIVAQAPPEA